MYVVTGDIISVNFQCRKKICADYCVIILIEYWARFSLLHSHRTSYKYLSSAAVVPLTYMYDTCTCMSVRRTRALESSVIHIIKL